jgi:protein phosphatase
MRGKMDCFGQTDTGKVRRNNEDQFLIADLNKSMLIHQTSLSHDDHTRLFGTSQGQLLLVADGMGGHEAGEQASRLAVETLSDYIINTRDWFYRQCEEQEEDLKDELREALEQCQQRVTAASESRPELHKMGTTLTLAYLLWPRLFVVHAGDSRCYLLRGQRLEQITRDHTMAQKLVESGMLRADEAHESRWSHVLWNCIGGGSTDLQPDVYKAHLEVGDSLLLCTDGLTAHLGDEEIAALLGEKAGAVDTCRRLVDAAIERGGQDNITVIVAHFRSRLEMTARALHEATSLTETATSRPEIQETNEHKLRVEPV